MGELREEPEDLDPIERHRYHDTSVVDLHVPGAFRLDSPPTSPPRKDTSGSQDVEDTEEVKMPEGRKADQPSPLVIADKRSHRPKTQFSVAHPPPSIVPLRKQGIARPRALFQLQVQADSRFHRPIYELVPLSRIDGTRKVGQLIRRLGKAKENITNEDLAVVRVANYNTTGISKDSFDVPESRDIIGIVSPAPSQPGATVGRAQIFLDGAVWNATPGRDGRYDLQCIGTEKHTARWYIPKARRKRAESPGPSASDRKLYFAAILPHTTKHPTLASLNKTNLDMYDWYTLNTDQVTQDMLTPLESSTPATQISQSNYWSEQYTETSSTAMFNVPIDELHRKLIVVSSFWVMLCEGWSSTYTFPLATTSTSSSSTPVERSMSLPVTKVDRPAISNLPLPPSTLSTRQTTPELQAMSVNSPAPSIAPDLATPASKRLSLGSFTFRRVSTTATRNADAESSSFRSSIAASTQTEQSAVTSEMQDETLLVRHVDSSSSASDPTTQFRHLDTLQRSNTSNPSRLTTSRFGSIVRRMSNSTPIQDERSRRNRSISWRWNRATPIKPAIDVQVESEHCLTHPLMTHNNTPLTISGYQEEASVELTACEDCITLDGSTMASTNEAMTHPEIELEPATEQTPIRSEVTPVVSNKNSMIKEDVPTDDDGQDVLGLPSAELIPPTISKENSPTTRIDSRRWSVSSSGSEQLDVGSPYWRDFDRLQMNTFWQRAPYIPSTPSSPQRHGWTANDDASQDYVDEDVVETIEQTEEAKTPVRGGSFMESILQSIGRRRYSSFAA